MAFFCFILKPKIALFYLFSFVFVYCTSPCHSLSLIVIYYHSLSFVVTPCPSLSLGVTRFITRCHSLSIDVTLAVIRCTTRCHSLYHSLSFPVTRCHLPVLSCLNYLLADFVYWSRTLYVRKSVGWYLPNDTFLCVFFHLLGRSYKSKDKSYNPLIDS